MEQEKWLDGAQRTCGGQLGERPKELAKKREKAQEESLLLVADTCLG